MIDVYGGKNKYQTAQITPVRLQHVEGSNVLRDNEAITEWAD